jgi:outer membrane lipoprotein-sorting protein
MRKPMFRTRVLLLVVLVFLLVLTAAGQPAGFRAVKDIDNFKAKFAAGSGKILSISSDFKQEKELTALTEKITSTGKFWFKRSDRVRIDYEKPFVYRMVMNGDRVLLKDEQKENRINVKSNKLFQQVNRIMLDCIQGTILNSRDFSTTVLENDRMYLLEMVPAGKNLKDLFSVIRLYVDKSDYSAALIEMNEPGGDRTLLSFSNKRINQTINDEVFAL